MKFIAHSSDDTPRNQTVESVRRLIVSHGLKPGDVLPTYDDLSLQFRVSRVTVKRAMDVLAASGHVRRLHGKGVYVAKRISRRASDISRVGVIVTSRVNLFNYAYLREIMTGIVTICERDDMDLSILSLRDLDAPMNPEEVTSVVDSVLILGEIHEAYVKKFVGLNVPVVVVDHRTEKVPLDCLVCDNAGATRQVVDHLVSIGHRHIVFSGSFLGPIPILQRRHFAASSDTPERRDAYLAVMAEHGLSAQAQVFDSPEVLIKTLQPRSKRSARHPAKMPTAVVVSDVMSATDLCQKLLGRGIRVPEDISVVAAVGSPGDTQWNGHTLTCCRVRFNEMGSAAVMQLQKRCGSVQPKAPNVIRVGFDFFTGTTTAAFPMPGRRERDS